jgi:ABC-type multidrug transport system fused ATPase/permease subunit
MGDFFLQATDARAVRRSVVALSAAGGACLLTDAFCAAVLLLSLHGWRLEDVRPRWAALRDFHGDVFDVAAWSAARLLLLPLVAAAAARAGRREEDATAETAPPPPPAPPRARRDSLTEPLLPVSTPPAAADAAPADASAAAAPSPPPLSAEGLQASHARDAVLLRRRDALLALLFALCTAAAVFTGVKVVSFTAFGPSGSEQRALRGGLLAALAALATAENVLLSRAVALATRRPGVLRPELHPHALFYASDKSIVAHRCDCCRGRVTEGFRCNVCDFDCCLPCLARRDLRAAEGGLRGDRGLRTVGAAPPTAYFARALSLARSEAPLLAAAFACLAATTAATLALPNFQGRILDTVWRGDATAFRKDVLLLILYSTASGAFGGARSLCFNLVGRRLAFDLRNGLLRAILRQDTAFFDAAATGDLTSRLSYDVANTLNPVQTLLSSVVENSALLVGALAACFLQSWQLALLAVTTLTPATYVTQLYAAWSSTLNRHIAAALGEGNAAATEALGNIRTVRAMSTESEEAAKYEERTRRALQCGVRDACGGALAYALNNYLDLFTSVLILYFGGSIALRNHAAGVTDGLTAGRLVTFTLYWGIFNGSFRALQSLLASFTRAAGSAQRVLSLMDAIPDIPKEGGLCPSTPLRGDVALHDVSFAYQMRAHAPVLRSVALSVRAGSVCALVGRSGGGKSTLCHLLLRLYDPSSGHITLDGIDLRQLDLRWVHRQTGCVAQDTQLFAHSIRENIAYGCPWDAAESDILDAARAAHAHDFIAEFPEGYDTRVGERGVRLSGGAFAFWRMMRVLRECVVVGADAPCVCRPEAAHRHCARAAAPPGAAAAGRGHKRIRRGIRSRGANRSRRAHRCRRAHHRPRGASPLHRGQRGSNRGAGRRRRGGVRHARDARGAAGRRVCAPCGAAAAEASESAGGGRGCGWGGGRGGG